MVGLSVLIACFAGTTASASWLSNATGVNINLNHVRDGFKAAAPPTVVAVKVPSPVVQPPITVEIVDAQSRAAVIDKISEYYSTTSKIAAKYQYWALAIVLGAIAFGLAASIAGFCKASTLAGILSIMATGIVGIGNAVPINQNADFYQVLSAHSHELLTDAQLHPKMTVPEFEGYREQLSVLLNYEGDKFPSRSGTQQAVQDLVAELRRPAANGAGLIDR